MERSSDFNVAGFSCGMRVLKILQFPNQTGILFFLPPLHSFYIFFPVLRVCFSASGGSRSGIVCLVTF